MVYEKQNFQDGAVLTAQSLNHIEEGLAEAVSCITTLEEAGTPAGVTEAMELINTITVTEEGTRSVVFDDNFCLKKFILKAYFAGVSEQTTRSVTFSMMEKLDDGQYKVFYTATMGLIVNNSPRYFTAWGDSGKGTPITLHMSKAGQYPDAAVAIDTIQSPVVVNKGLTRLFFSDTTVGNLPVGSKFELWGVRA